MTLTDTPAARAQPVAPVRSTVVPAILKAAKLHAAGVLPTFQQTSKLARSAVTETSLDTSGGFLRSSVIQYRFVLTSGMLGRALL
jgi:hypothetical protein